jgi:uncharacterized protein (DUF2062 family)
MVKRAVRGTLTRRVKAYLLGLKLKIVHDRLPPERVALGWGIGMFYGCLIPFGFQLIISVPTAMFFKASKIGATLGTLITNPVTIWFLYPAQCYLANRLIGGELSYDAIGSAMNKVINAGDYATLLSLGWELVVSFFLGGAILAAIAVPATYFSVKSMVVRYRSFKQKAAARSL